MLKEYKTIEKVTPSLLKVQASAAVGDFCDVMLADGGKAKGQVIAVGGKAVYIRISCPAARINATHCAVRFNCGADKISASPDMTGRIFSGAGIPSDGFERIISGGTAELFGAPVAGKSALSDCISTGISAVDSFTTLLEGQSLTVVVPRGVPHGEFLSALAAGVSPEFGEEKFTIVFGTVGVRAEDVQNLTEDFANSGNFERTVFFANLEEDPLESYITPHTALAVSEYLAFECGKRVVCVLDGLSNFVDSLYSAAESVSDALGEKVVRPDVAAELAVLYARAGKKEGEKGSITLICALNESGNTAQTAELTGKLSDEQIYLSEKLYARGIYPPVDIAARGAKPKEREGHELIFARLAEYYRKGTAAREKISNGAAFSAEDNAYAAFADGFEKKIIAQNLTRVRTVEQSLVAAAKLTELIGEFVAV